MIKRVAIYCRVSTDEQARKGESIDAQEEQCRRRFELLKLEAADKHRVELHDVYKDPGHSGKDLKRPAMIRLANDVERGVINTIIATSVDRISRRVRDFEDLWEYLEEKKVVLYFIKHNFDTSTAMGRAMMRFALEFSQMEREMIAERTRDAYHRKIENGRYAGGGHGAPFGLRQSKTLPLRGHLEWDEEESSVALTLIDKFFELGSVLDLHKYVVANNIRFRTGVRKDGLEVTKDWTYEKLKNFLTSAHLIGKIEINKENEGEADITSEYEKYKCFDAVWGPLIPESKFNQIKEKIALNKTRNHKGKRRDHSYPLVGLLVCNCDKQYAGSSTSPRDGYTYIRYVLNKGCDCQVRAIPASRIEDFVFQRVKKVLGNRKIFDGLVEAGQQHVEKQLQAMLKQIKEDELLLKRLKTKRGRLVDQLLNQADTRGQTSLRGELESLETELAKVNQDIDARQEEYKRLLDKKGEAKEVKQFIKRFENLDFDALNADAKRHLLETLISKIVVKDGLSYAIHWSFDFSSGSSGGPGGGSFDPGDTGNGKGRSGGSNGGLVAAGFSSGFRSQDCYVNVREWGG